MQEKEFVTINGQQYELGPIMPGDVEPVHVGWYARQWAGSSSGWHIRDYWDGKYWYIGFYDSCHSEFPDLNAHMKQWRGLARPYIAPDTSVGCAMPGITADYECRRSPWLAEIIVYAAAVAGIAAVVLILIGERKLPF